MAVSVSTGAVAAEYDYDSFGQRTLVQGTEEVRYGFTAREHDARTGLIHYRARAYDPLTGRFLQRDPIGFASGDLNLYAYVENDPYNWTDPSGLTAVDGAATIGRSAGMSTGLSGLFGGVLNLANAIRASLVSAAAIGTGVAMNQSGDGERGIGDNGGPPLDDDPDAGPPDPLDPISAFLAAVGATVVSIDTDGAVHFQFDHPAGRLDVQANFSMEADTLVVENALIYGPGAQSIGPGQLRRLAEQLGRENGANTVIFRGFRVSGANPGRDVDMVFPVR
nr:RHS repeat-associated core domain-containing protein [Boseongicola sp. H5]